MKKTSWKLFTATLTAMLLIFETPIEQVLAKDYNQLVPILPRSEINQALTSPTDQYMTSAFGVPDTVG